MKYQRLSGTIYEVEEKRLAGGGEGNVHTIIGNAEQVAKIFKESKRDAWREEKLRLMMQENLSEKQIRQVTWPQDVIYDQNGFAGYIMPKLVNSFSLTELYTEEKYDLRFRLMAAVNLCAAVDTVHQMGQVCGDLNPQNIFVNLDQNDRQNGFMVTLVDTDSYHFTANGKTYRCEVGLGEFIAPELQNKMTVGCDLKTVSLPSYTRETDLFALAVHIFCLLMNGCHPFACAKNTAPGESNISQMTAGKREDSNVCPQPIDNIKNGFFPFYDKNDGIVIPVYAPEFESLPDEIRKMFIRTFVDGDKEPSRRVTASGWWQVLRMSLKNIRECDKVGSHYYFDHVSECPLCKMEKRLIELYMPSLPPSSHTPPPSPNPSTLTPAASTEPLNPPIAQNNEELSIKYRIGGILMFMICAAMTFFRYSGMLYHIISMAFDLIQLLIMSDIRPDIVERIIAILVRVVYFHSGFLLLQTQSRGKFFLVFYSILYGIALCQWGIYIHIYRFDLDKIDPLDYVFCIGEVVGFILLIMKCRYWKKRQKTKSN